ncbi:hypothetical protein AAFF_G00267950 [Aldrovandia affinis]|uniref:Uncharacterized protein n=1 Tax=Aldrovandia affinis TaxID=143900 RepID=A0AAD7STZ3_9TELE|nr:hypothetical protein AAFF_G00267950 [Aldrovandia affinis]
MKRRAGKGAKTAVSNNEDDGNDCGGDTNAENETLPNPKRKRAYKVMLEEETIVGEALEGSSRSEKNKLDIEGRYPQGSWEQATVEAIMNLRTFDTTTSTSQIAQTIIANLKDENDFLRAQNIKLQWELKSMQQKHAGELQAAKEELRSLEHRCTCAAEHATSPPAVTGPQVTETVVAGIVDTGALALKPETERSFQTVSSEHCEVGTLLIVDHAVQTEIIACTATNARKQNKTES